MRETTRIFILCPSRVNATSPIVGYVPSVGHQATRRILDLVKDVPNFGSLGDLHIRDPPPNKFGPIADNASPHPSADCGLRSPQTP